MNSAQFSENFDVFRISAHWIREIGKLRILKIKESEILVF